MLTLEWLEWIGGLLLCFVDAAILTDVICVLTGVYDATENRTDS